MKGLSRTRSKLLCENKRVKGLQTVPCKGEGSLATAPRLVVVVKDEGTPVAAAKFSISSRGPDLIEATSTDYSLTWYALLLIAPVSSLS